MSEIKPVAWINKGKTYVELSTKSTIYGSHTIPLYHLEDYEALQAENTKLKDHLSEAQHGAMEIFAAQAKRIAEIEEDLQFVERWANHHGTKQNITAQEALSCIQHYPSIAAITKRYKDGAIPKTRNPYAEIEALRKQVKLHEETQSNELRKSRETVKELLDQKREVMDILLLRIDPYEIIKRAGSALSAQKGTENGTS